MMNFRRLFEATLEGSRTKSSPAKESSCHRENHAFIQIYKHGYVWASPTDDALLCLSPGVMSGGVGGGEDVRTTLQIVCCL
jgi:hypothetical protein